MRLTNRKRLAKLMVIQGVSARSLAQAAGWKSHSYMNRLLSGDVKHLDTEAAHLIARHLGVQPSDLFVPKQASDDGRTRKAARAA